MKNDRGLSGGIVASLGLAGSGCDDDKNDSAPVKTTKAAWIYVSEIGDGGWTYARNQGRLKVEAEPENVATTSPNLAARDAGIYIIGYDTDVSAAAPDTVLTSAVCNYGAHYVKRMRAIHNGSRTVGSSWGGLHDGIVGLGSFCVMGSDSVRTEAAAKQIQIAAGALDFSAGSISKADGSAWVAEYDAIADADRLCMGEAVLGVIEVHPSE